MALPPVGQRHAAAIAKSNGVEPLAGLTDVLERTVLCRIKADQRTRLPPWDRQAERLAAAADA